MLYFAYGSNMNLEQMQYRCPGSKPVGAARLRGWSLRERLHADIEEEEWSVVEGVLWEVTGNHVFQLDAYEGYPRYYTRLIVTVEVEGGERVEAFAYKMMPLAATVRDDASFGEKYAIICATGAKENGIEVDPLFLQKIPARKRHLYS